MEKDYATVNRDVWNADAPNWVDVAERLWALDQPEWGNWGASDAPLGLLPADMTGMNAVELGCGTGYVSAWMARRGARVTAIDISAAQLDTARRLARQHGADITFIEGNAEATGLDATAFDFAISEYGASIWCRPEIWLREAWRLLKPGGTLVFLGNHPLVLLSSPMDGSDCDWQLHRPYRDMWGADWTEVAFEPSGVCFNLTFADWFTLFSEIGFVVKNYHELYVPDYETHTKACIPADWGKQYPVEQVWVLSKSA